MILPVVDGVTVAVQLAVVALTTVNGLLQALNVPVAVPPFVMATDPAGVEAVPGEMLSLTNTVHVITWPTATDEGAHVTTVDVARVPTVTVLRAAGHPFLLPSSSAVVLRLLLVLPVLVGVIVAVHLESVALKDTH